MANTVLIRREIIALARGTTDQALQRDMKLNRFPRPDTRVPSAANTTARAWAIDTLHRFDPALAERCRSIADFLENLPLAA